MKKAAIFLTSLLALSACNTARVAPGAIPAATTARNLLQRQNLQRQSAASGELIKSKTEWHYGVEVLSFVFRSKGTSYLLQMRAMDQLTPGQKTTPTAFLLQNATSYSDIYRHGKGPHIVNPNPSLKDVSPKSKADLQRLATLLKGLSMDSGDAMLHKARGVELLQRMMAK